ncbi:unnamed protein product [Enterobius vermicularis]|uniref:DUF2040 domain-containing protein n=1 Tax=Enterobius vermicularis TaxID=51028 RepID=A0A0N4VAD0_ENTVE|nr:unnamed protein product [Enterobius vermicularis]
MVPEVAEVAPEIRMIFQNRGLHIILIMYMLKKNSASYKEPVAEQKEHFMFPPEVEEEPVSEATTEEEPKEKSPFDFWKKKEEQAKKAKETNPIQFKYGQTQAEAARKERAFKLKESSRFKFWKDREKEYKKAEKRKIQMQKGGRAALNIEDRDSEEDE